MKESLLENFEKLKRQISRLREERIKAEGAMTQLLKQMREQFGCSSVEEARGLLSKVEKEMKELEKRFQDEYRRFTEEWGEELEKLGESGAG